VSRVPRHVGEIDALWNQAAGNLENAFLPYDFLRQRDPHYEASRPLVLCKDWGMMAMFSMEGADPEVLSNAEKVRLRDGVRRAFDVFGSSQMERPWRSGVWEVQNIFVRRVGVPPTIRRPSRPSVALTNFVDTYNSHWAQEKEVFEDEILWAIKFTPAAEPQTRSLLRHLLAPVWELFRGASPPQALAESVAAQALFVRRQLRAFEKTMKSVASERPPSDLEVHWLTEEETRAALCRQANRKGDPGPKLRRSVPLVAQVASSRRDNRGDDYLIDDQLAKVLTWKDPPDVTVEYLFENLQRDIRFPFSVVQNFASIDFSKMDGTLLGLERRRSMAIALSPMSPHCADFAAEATALQGAVRSDRCAVFRWYFAIIVTGANKAELEERTAQLTMVLKRFEGGQVLEEPRRTRMLGELATLPGNARYGMRRNLATSRNAADLAMVYRLSRGDAEPYRLFGDRQGGVYSCSIISEFEACSNKAFVGPPGSGKTTLAESFMLATMAHRSQGYVIDEGNSYGAMFEMLQNEHPDEVAVMRFTSDVFSFNPCNVAWALEEIDAQKRRGDYRRRLSDGTQVPCPLQEEQVFFVPFLTCLITQGRGPLTGAEKNQLDLALRGDSGNGGFFQDYIAICQDYLEDKRAGRPTTVPRPLSLLRPHLKKCKFPEFWDAIEVWTRPPRAKYFDSGIDAISKARYIYFELSGLEREPDLLEPFAMALTGQLWRKVQDPLALDEVKLVIWDEVWKRLTQPAFRPVIEAKLRQGRKFKMVGGLLTQSLLDLVTKAPEFCENISEFFLWGGFVDPTLLERLQLQPHQIRQYTSLRTDDKTKEVFHVTKRGMNRILSVELEPSEYWYVTTHADDKHWREAFFRHFGLVTGIAELVKACDGKTVMNPKTRIEKVSAHAAKLGIVPRSLAMGSNAAA
jgi:hypothetical protein